MTVRKVGLIGEVIVMLLAFPAMSVRLGIVSIMLDAVYETPLTVIVVALLKVEGNENFTV